MTHINSNLTPISLLPISIFPVSILPESILPWDEYREDRIRYWKFVGYTFGAFFVVFFILGVLIDAPPIERNKLEKIPPQVARMILNKKKKIIEINQVASREKKPPTPPTLKNKPAEDSQKVESVRQSRKKNKTLPKTASKEQIKKAKLKVARVGVLAMSEQLSRLRDMAVSQNLPTKFKNGNGHSARNDRDLISRKAVAGSGGIQTTQSGLQKTSLKSNIATSIKAPSDAVKNTSGKSLVRRRSSEEIALVFDRHKSVFHSLYRQAARKKLGLQGRVVFRIKIMPDGNVTECSIVFSELKHRTLERKLIARIKLMNFGAKDVMVWKDNYHIDFSSSG